MFNRMKKVIVLLLAMGLLVMQSTITFANDKTQLGSDNVSMMNGKKTSNVRPISNIIRKNLQIPKIDQQNLALNKLIEASSTEPSITYDDGYVDDFSAKNSVDGDIATRWASQQGIAFTDGGNAPEWITVDLGNNYALDRVLLIWHDYYAKSYQIQVSKDKINWKTIYKTTSGDGDIDDVSTSLNISGRYLRVYCTEQWSGDYDFGYSLWDMAVYGFQVPNDWDSRHSFALPTEPNLALKRPVMASSQEVQTDFLPSEAVDGDVETRWSSAYTDNEWIYVDLGSTCLINRLLIIWEKSYAKDYI